MATEKFRYWEEKHKATSYLIGPDQKLTVPALMNFMQETAGQHANAAGAGHLDVLQKGKVWMLSRVKLLIDKLPGWEEEITVKTWVSQIHSAYTHREFSIKNSKGEEFACASTLWALIDLEKRRPVNIDGYGANMPVNEEDVTKAGSPIKVPKLDHSDNYATFPVRYSELDMLRHVNNTKYVNWVMDVFQPAFHFSHRLKEMDVNFLAETNFGEEVKVFTEQVESSREYLHAVRKENDQDACRIRTVWEELD
jgi:medium-chain acyl-[acyl-carrier-protein] hydrolase